MRMYMYYCALKEKSPTFSTRSLSCLGKLSGAKTFCLLKPNRKDFLFHVVASIDPCGLDTISTFQYFTCTPVLLNEALLPSDSYPVLA